MKYYNLLDIEKMSHNYEDIILLVFAATRYGTVIPCTEKTLIKKLHIRPRNPDIMYIAYKWRSYHTIESILPPGTPFHTVSQTVLFARLDYYIRVCIIKLAAMLTIEQRWRHKLYGHRLTVPLAVGQQYLHTDIPNEWIEVKNNLIYLKIEENKIG